jgi:hypothetical protein
MFKNLNQVFASPARAKLLKFFLFQPDVRVTAQAAGAAIGISRKIAEKECRALAALGILSARKQKSGGLFSFNPAYEHATALRAFLEATTLPSDKRILEAFRGSGASLIAATGVLANEERASVDILIVGKKGKHKGMKDAIYRLECSIGLPLRYAILEPASYTSRLEGNDRLIRDVIEFKHRLISGHF